MKRAIALLLSACLVVTLFSGCGGEEKPITTQPPYDGESLAVVETASPTAPSETETTTPVLVDTVVFDSDGIKITATGIEMDAYSGINLKFLVENNTDKNIAFSGNYFVINGITMTGYLYIDAAAGKKANGALELFQNDLDAMGITNIATFAGGDTYIHDTDSYETICQVPFSGETSANGTYMQAIDDSGDVVFDQRGVTVIAKSIKEGDFSTDLQFLIKNNTGKDIICEATNISVNGFTIDAWMYDVIYADTVKLCKMEIYADTLEENSIETVEDVTFRISVIEDQTYSPITTSEELQIFATK